MSCPWCPATRLPWPSPSRPSRSPAACALPSTRTAMRAGAGSAPGGVAAAGVMARSDRRADRLRRSAPPVRPGPRPGACLRRRRRRDCRPALRQPGSSHTCPAAGTGPGGTAACSAAMRRDADEDSSRRSSASDLSRHLPTASSCPRAAGWRRSRTGGRSRRRARLPSAPRRFRHPPTVAEPVPRAGGSVSWREPCSGRKARPCRRCNRGSPCALCPSRRARTR